MARSFNGTTQYLDGSNPVSDTPLTLAAWFYLEVKDSGREIMNIIDDGVINRFFRLSYSYGDDALRAVTKNGPTIGAAVSTSGPSLNTWHHGCAVFTSKSLRDIYLDGGSKGTNTTNVNTPSVDAMRIGVLAQVVDSQFWDGNIAEVAIWNVALTDAEAAILATGVSPLLVRPQSLVFYLPCIRDNDNDLVGGLSLTPIGSPGIAAHPRVIYPGQSFPGVPSAADVYVTPAAAAALAATVDPSVVLGSISITPAVAEVLAAALDPGVVLGSILVTPAVAEALAATVDPSVVLGSLNITPAVAQALAGTVDPSVILGSVALTPAMAEALAQTQDPAVVLGSLSVTPALALALAAAQDPLVVLGSIILTPEVAEALALALDPGVTMGSMSVTPPLISALCEALDPNVIISGGPVVPHLRILNLWWTFGVGGRR